MMMEIPVPIASSTTVAASQALPLVSTCKRKIPLICSSIQDVLGRIGVAVRSLSPGLGGGDDPLKVRLADNLVTLQDELAVACEGYKKVVGQITNNPWVEDRAKYDAELRKFLQLANETESQHRQSLMSNPSLLSPVEALFNFENVAGLGGSNSSPTSLATPAVPRSPSFAEAIPRFEGDMVDYFEWKRSLENLLSRRPNMGFLRGYLLRNGLSCALRVSVGVPQCLHSNFDSIMALMEKFYGSAYLAVSGSVRTLVDRVHPDDSNGFLAHRFLNYVRGLSEMRDQFPDGTSFADHLLLGLFESKLPDRLSCRWDAFIIKRQGGASFPTLALFVEFAEMLRDEAVQRSNFPRPI